MSKNHLQEENPVDENVQEAFPLYEYRKGFRYMKHYGPKEFWSQAAMNV